MNGLQIFTNEELGGGIRVLEKDGQAWFVGKDVAGILGYGDGNKNSKALNNAVKGHVDEEDKGVAEMVTPGGIQKITIINESGVYALTLSSKLPKAKVFKRWVTSEVLPSIRKTGSYTNGIDIENTIRMIMTAFMEQLPAIITETVSQTITAVLNADVGNYGSRAASRFQLLDIADQPAALLTGADLEETEFWERLLLEWRRFRVFIKSKAEADKAFIALCHEKYPDLHIGLRTLYRKWNSYEKSGRQALTDGRGRHGNHRRKVVVTVEV